MGRRRSLFRRSIAWPSDHGSWVFLLSPLIIGLSAGGRWTTPVAYLVAASLCGFLVRQPATVAVKALGGRRSRDDLLPALGCTTLNLFAVAALGLDGTVSAGLWVAYLPQWIDGLVALYRPAIGVTPTRIGLRQVAVSTLYTLLFVWAW